MTLIIERFLLPAASIVNTDVLLDALMVLMKERVGHLVYVHRSHSDADELVVQYYMESGDVPGVMGARTRPDVTTFCRRFGILHISVVSYDCNRQTSQHHSCSYC